jgi:hypothetical protein
MNLEPQAMAGSMPEGSPKSMGFKHFSCRSVDRARPRPRLDGGDGGSVRLFDGVVEAAQVLSR